MKHYYLKLTEAERDALLNKLEGNSIPHLNRATDELNVDSIRIKLRTELPVELMQLKPIINKDRIEAFREEWNDMMSGIDTSNFTAKAQIATNE